NTNTESVFTAKKLCDIMTDTSTPLASDLDYASRPMKVVELYDGPNTTMNNDYDSSWASAKDVYFSFDGTGRGWMWLCCNGLGWLQSTDWGHGIFHDSVPFNYYTKVCSDIFSPEIGPAYIRDQNHASQEYYGGLDHFNATNLFLPNGSLDPWHALGYYKADEKNHVIPYLIPGTAHCGDMYAPWDGPTLPALKEVHAKILSELQYYLQAK
uniref:Tannase/feruloyl esterase family alpha/beta hydrolase n=1 Tax=Steinernema glaseri TaxID=37863 RepID=A0A1I7Y2F2_9BILA